jgi:mono/diheme cytochrome c family protein
LFIVEVNMATKSAVLLGMAGIFLGVFLVGQGTGNSQTKDYHLKTVSISQSPVDSGKIMYKQYCAVCHGLDGKGNGPAVQFLKAPPPDLTTMARRYNAESITPDVASVLRFGTGSAAHGTLDMPMWGPLFKSLDGNDQVGKLRMYNLAKYVQSMQKK